MPDDRKPLILRSQEDCTCASNRLAFARRLPIEPVKTSAAPHMPGVKPEIPSKAPRLSEEIAGLISIVTDHPVRLRDLMEVMHGRAYTLLLILLSLPFLTPVPVPGVSTPFGTVMALIGLRLSLRWQPWLPERVLNHRLSPAFLKRVLPAALRLTRGLEFLLRPRWSLLLDFGPLYHLYGFMIMVCGGLLLLPMPLPFSNFLPAVTIALLAAAMLEKDGYCVVAGLLMFFVTVSFFAVVFFGGASALMRIKELFVVVSMALCLY